MPPVRPHVHSEDAVALLDFVLQWFKTEQDRTEESTAKCGTVCKSGQRNAGGFQV
jgi:hypothetical protein